MTAKRTQFMFEGVPFEGYFDGRRGRRWNGWAIPLVTSEQLVVAVAAINEGRAYPYGYEARGDGLVVVTTCDPADEPEVYGADYAVITPQTVETEDGALALYALDLSWAFEAV